MRGVYVAVAAALSAASASASRVSGIRQAIAEPADAKVAIADVTLQLIRPKDSFIIPLPLRFQVEQSSQPCSPTSLRVNGQVLQQDDAGSGSGAFAVRGGSDPATASWTFTCRDDGGELGPEQELNLVIHSLDGDLVKGGNVDVRYRGLRPVDILQVSGAVTQHRVNVHGEAQDTQDDEASDHQEPDEQTSIRAQVEKQIAELRDLQDEVALQKQNIRDKEEALLALMNQLPPQQPAELIGDSQLVLGLDGAGGLDRMIDVRAGSEGIGRRRIPFLVTSIVAAIFLPILAFILIRRRRRRCTARITLPATPNTNFSPLSFTSHHRQPHPQPSQHSTQQQQDVPPVCRKAVDHVSGTDTSIDEKRYLSEKNDSATQCRSPWPTELDTTVEEELAGFSEAARMVTDLIAAEEGRTGTPRRDVPQRRRSDSDVPEYTPYDAPPAYEDQVHGPPLVTDGSRYNTHHPRNSLDDSPPYRDE